MSPPAPPAHQRGLAVVHVRDDGNVPDVLLHRHPLPARRGGRCTGGRGRGRAVVRAWMQTSCALPAPTNEQKAALFRSEFERMLPISSMQSAAAQLFTVVRPPAHSLTLCHGGGCAADAAHAPRRLTAAGLVLLVLLLPAGAEEPCAIGNHRESVRVGLAAQAGVYKG